MTTNLIKKSESIIVELYKEGKTVTEIKNILKLKYVQPVTNVLRRKGLGEFKNKKSRKELNNPENVKKILELREQNLNVLQIANELKLYHQLVVNILKRENRYTKKEVVPNRKYTINEEYFRVINDSKKAYILGFICADGHIAKDRISISLSIKDIDILEKIKECVGSNSPITFYESENPYKKGKKICKMCSLNLNSVKLVSYLGFIPQNKTYNLNSSILENIPNLFIKDFLRGYFDGDGNVMWGKKYNSGYKYNINVCGNEEFLLNTFNKFFPSTNKMYKDKYSKQCWVWKISSKQKVFDFLKFLYEDSDIYLNRKFEIYKSAHVKPIELLETQTSETRAISSEASIEERSETIETTC